MIEHAGIVQKVADGRATVAMQTGGCSGCGHVGGCSVGKMAAGRPATLLELAAPAGCQAGDRVSVQLPEGRLPLMALIGYFLPALAMLVGAGIGQGVGGSDGATALGALLGFVGALVLGRVLVALLPSLMPDPRIVPQGGAHATHFVPVSNLLNPESYHER